jgi:hypothetical protein
LKKLKPLDRENFLADIASGMRVHDAADKSPWSHAWWYQLKDQDESFAEAWEEAARMGARARLERMEKEADRRALDGVEEPVGFHQGVAGAWVKRYSDRLLVFRAQGEAKRAGDQSYQDRPGGDGAVTINIHLDSGFQAFRDCILGALEPYPEAWEAVIGAMGDYVGKSEASAQEAPQGRREPKTIKGDG